MKWAVAGVLVALAALLVGLAVSLSAPKRAVRGEMAAGTPDELIASVFEAVEKGRPDLLPDLIYAPTPEFRPVLDRLGALCGNVQTLARALNERFPTEVATLRGDAAGSGAGALLRSAQRGMQQAQQGGQGGRRGGGPEDGRFLVALLADPYGWLARSKERVSTVEIAADSAAVLVDNKPAFGVGLLLRKDKGRWWIDLPWQIPQVAKYAPRTPEEHNILGFMVQSVDNAVIDLTKDVKAGKAASLEETSRLAGEKAFAPLMMCVIAYDRAMKAREQGAQRSDSAQ